MISEKKANELRVTLIEKDFDVISESAEIITLHKKKEYRKLKYDITIKFTAHSRDYSEEENKGGDLVNYMSLDSKEYNFQVVLMYSIKFSFFLKGEYKDFPSPIIKDFETDTLVLKYLKNLKKNYDKYYKQAKERLEYPIAKEYLMDKPNLQSLNACLRRLSPKNRDKIEYDFVEYLSSQVQLDKLKDLITKRTFPLSLISKMIDKMDTSKLFFIAKTLGLIDYQILKRMEGTPYYDYYRNEFKILDVYESIKENKIIAIDKKTLNRYRDYLEQLCQEYDNDASRRIYQLLREENNFVTARRKFVI